MANLLKVVMIDGILSLHQRGWSQRRIARELGIDRETVARHLRQPPAPAKPAHRAHRLVSCRWRFKTSHSAPRLRRGLTPMASYQRFRRIRAATRGLIAAPGHPLACFPVRGKACHFPAYSDGVTLRCAS
jgi:orotate phosphoribosyltransferase-like protein